MVAAAPLGAAVAPALGAVPAPAPGVESGAPAVAAAAPAVVGAAPGVAAVAPAADCEGVTPAAFPAALPCAPLAPTTSGLPVSPIESPPPPPPQETMRVAPTKNAAMPPSFFCIHGATRRSRIRTYDLRKPQNSRPIARRPCT